ncbi:MalY/PatB family protein [Butyrivibrio sp. AE3009]|uniref:MalY/PatB family protein n=1 Tax=Butyrivibrio sp. AE3009 TaxID=1280666 RepID=UPI0003B3BD12|nr:MalY/PatB family protein [Butyrivibrio sp. AE3009]
MSKYDFDKIVDRRGTSCIKYDFQQERKHRDDLLPLWVADMDFPLPEEILEDLHKRVDHGIFGYTDPKEDYFEALSGWYRRRQGFEIKAEDTFVTPGIVYSIALAVRACTEEGDSVIIQEPVYYPFRSTIQQNKRKCVSSNLVFDREKGKYFIDFEDFEQKIVDNKVKLFILCSPHNPVGRVWTRQELTRLGDICLKHDVKIFADEIHSDFVYGDNKHTSFLTLGDKYADITILGISPSKTFNIAGLQVANVISRNKELLDKFKLQNDAAGYSQGGALGMVAAISCYNKGEQWVEELLQYLQGNISYIRDFLKEKLPKIELIEPEGTYLIWLDFSKVTGDYRELKRLIEDEAKLWLDGGVIFGRESALLERINVACPRATLETAMNRLYEAFKDR